MAAIEIPYPFRPYTEGNSKVEVDAHSVNEALHCLVERFPNMTMHLFDDMSKLRSFILVFLDDEDIRYIGGLEAGITAQSTLKIIPSIAGGSNCCPPKKEYICKQEATF